MPAAVQISLSRNWGPFARHLKGSLPYTTAEIEHLTHSEGEDMQRVVRKNMNRWFYGRALPPSAEFSGPTTTGHPDKIFMVPQDSESYYEQHTRKGRLERSLRSRTEVVVGGSKTVVWIDQAFAKQASTLDRGGPGPINFHGRPAYYPPRPFWRDSVRDLKLRYPLAAVATRNRIVARLRGGFVGASDF